MRGLIKADFKRISKDKLLMVMAILAVVFAAITPLLYAALFSDPFFAEDPMFSSFVFAKDQFFDSFSIGNNLGLIAPVLLGIALCKDFSFGTVRNKIIVGKSRSAIFLSLFITCATALVGVMLLHAFATLGISLIFFDYQPTAFTVSDFWYFLESLGFAILTLLWVAALLSCLCVSVKNVGLVIVLYIASSFVLVLAGGIISISLPFLEMSEASKHLVAILDFVDRINVGTAINYIGNDTSYTLEDTLYLTISPIVGILGFLGLGLWRFNKKDLK